MKKLLAIATLGLLAWSCSSDNESVMGNPENGGGSQQATSFISQMFSNGSSMSIGSAKSMRARFSSRANPELTPSEIVITEELKKEIRLDHIAHFPEATNNINKDFSDEYSNFSHDFLMVSDGGTVDVMLLYTCYANHTGDYFAMFWLEEDGTYNPNNYLVLWKETATDAELTAKKSPHYYVPEGNEAVRFSLPAGTKYGFFFYNIYEGARHFTSSEINVTGNPTRDPAKVNVKSMVTYMYDGYQVMSMDSTFPLSTSYDADVNDVVFLLRADRPRETSPQPGIVIPVYDATEDIYADADDFALSNNHERYPEYYNIGAEATRRIFVEKGDHLAVGITDFENLVYDEVYNEWTYETWVWLDELPTEEKYLYGSEESADWDTFTYANGHYLIGVSAYQGIAGQTDTGYVKVSVHIKENPDWEEIGGGIIITPQSL